MSEFYHAVWGGTLFDRQAFLSGCRRGKKQLCMITYDEGAYQMNVLDENVGPSNVHVLHLPETDVILSANREVGALAAYTLVQEDTQ